MNHYRSAEASFVQRNEAFRWTFRPFRQDFTSFHSDQYFGGVDMTIGASFGEERSLVFEHRETKEQQGGLRGLWKGLYAMTSY